ncbi:MAG: hypothetical protein OEW29_15665, partial [Acidimicrobiia bacterium]|nr:hypothetical protein [Acidimicrobiia bacterium]
GASGLGEGGGAETPGGVEAGGLTLSEGVGSASGGVVGVGSALAGAVGSGVGDVVGSGVGAGVGLGSTGVGDGAAPGVGLGSLEADGVGSTARTWGTTGVTARRSEQMTPAIASAAAVRCSIGLLALFMALVAGEGRGGGGLG